MSNSIRLSPKHGVNPSVYQCYYCHEDIGLILPGMIKGDEQMPFKCGVWNHDPCDKCKNIMKDGIIVISIKNGADEVHAQQKRDFDSDTARLTRGLNGRRSQEVENRPFMFNPHRTGGWIGLKDEFFTKHPVTSMDLSGRCDMGPIRFPNRRAS
jgi:hypothetical protein